MFKLLALIIFTVFMLSCSNLNIKNISCEKGSQCPINAICLEGHCVLESDNVSCTDDINCKNGEICNEGKCEPDSTPRCTTGEQTCEGNELMICTNNHNWKFETNCVENNKKCVDNYNGVAGCEEISCGKDCHGHGNCEININNNGTSTQICECTDSKYKGNYCNTCTDGYHKEDNGDIDSDCVKTCSTSEDCSKGICDESLQECVPQCTPDNLQNCPSNKKYCRVNIDPIDNFCVECLTNDNCSGDTPYCSPINNICVNGTDICNGIDCTQTSEENTSNPIGTCALSDTDGPSLPECFCPPNYFAEIEDDGRFKCISDSQHSCNSYCGPNGGCKVNDNGNYHCICKKGYTLLNNECRKLGIFVTNTDYTGNLDGIAGADDKCNNTYDTNHPSNTRYYKALLGLDSVRNEPSTDWPLLANFSYYSTNDKTIKIGTTTNEATFNVANNGLDNPISSSEYGYTVWTGLDVNGKVDAGDCNKWSSDSDSDSAFTASSDSKGKEAMSSTSSHCNGRHHLYCIEQVCPKGYTGNACDTCDTGYTHGSTNETCLPNHCTNNIKDEDETGLDCGGSCLECIQ